MASGEAEEQHDACEEEQRDAHEQRAERRRRPAGNRERREQQLSLRVPPVSCREHDLIGWKAGDLRHRNELEAAGAEARNGAFERGDRLGTIAAAVVEEDDAARVALRRDRVDDCLDSGAPPVLAVEIRKRDHVAVACEVIERTKLPLRHCSRVRRVWRPDEPRSEADSAGDGVLGQTDLECALPATQRGEIGVGERVVA
jgi:hypothetical protein